MSPLVKRVIISTSPEVDNQLFGPTDVKEQVVVWAPPLPALDLLSTGRLVVWDQPYHCGIICILDNDVCIVGQGTDIGKKGE